LVEGAGETADLIAAVITDLLVVATKSHLLGGLGHLLKRAGDRTGEEDGDEHADGEGGAAGEEEAGQKSLPGAADIADGHGDDGLILGEETEGPGAGAGREDTLGGAEEVNVVRAAANPLHAIAKVAQRPRL